MKKNQITSVNVIGLGYIGLPTALMLACGGIKVIGTDINQEIIDKLNSNSLIFREKRYDEIYSKAIKNNIVFTTEYVEADAHIISVPTPYVKNTKKVDPSYIIKALESVVSVCKDNGIVIIESTISPGTIDKYVRPFIESVNEQKGIRIDLVHAPERIIPGNMFFELENNARVIGADNLQVGEKIRELYSVFCKSNIVITDIRTAEMSKVVENTYRDINIAFANELTKICHEGGLDVGEVIRVANMHPRVNILRPGPGVGGHCISVDPWFLVGDYPTTVNIILAAREVNDSMPEYVLKRLEEIMQENGLKDVSRVGFYGLTYKEDVDDLRESPTLQLMEKMKTHLAANPKTYDPMICDKIFDNQYVDFMDFLSDIDIVVLMVAHTHFKNEIKKVERKIILDTRRQELPELKSGNTIHYL